MKKRLFVAMAVAIPVAFTSLLVAQSDRAVQVALEHFNRNARAYGLSSPSTELRERNQHVARGVTHVRFDQVYRGLPVFEGEAIAHVDADDNVTVTNAIAGNLNVNPAPRVGRNDAINTAVRFISPVGDYAVRDASLWILPRGERSIVNRLVWRVNVAVENEFEEPAEWQYFVDAGSGGVAFSYNGLETQGRGHGGGGGGGGGGATSFIGTGRTMYSGVVLGLSESKLNSTYSLVDLLRGASGGNSTCDMGNKQLSCTIFASSSSIFGNGLKDNSDRATAAADAHYGLQKTWDFYANLPSPFTRNGIDNHGKKTVSRVHYGRNYGNAFWSDSCFCMTYGDGDSTVYPLVSLDVAGHEMSHGVMATEANLTYSGESGGLNESNSDIFGTMVEFFANNPKDPGDYLIGEAIFKSNYDSNGNLKTTGLDAIRFMADPHADGISPACWTSNIGSLNVHYSSGPNNHMFFLLSQDATTTTVSKCDSNLSVTGIGREKAALIWYNAIANYMNANTNYQGARQAALDAAAQIYGAGSGEYNAVMAAFSAIHVN